MEDKFLNREGLGRFFEKIKSKFEPIDSPNFTGIPTVETPEFERMSSGKEVVNREYTSKMFEALTQYVDSERPSFHVRLAVKSEEWEEKSGIFYYSKLKEKVENIHFDQVSIFTRVDTTSLAPEKLLDVHKNHPVAIDKEGVIYTAGEKPTYELPIIIDLFMSTDMTQWFGGN